MITLDQATKWMLATMDNLRTTQAKTDPAYLSEQVYRLAQYTAAVEVGLGDLEQWYEESEAALLREAIKVNKMTASAAEKEVKMELGDVEGQIKYLKRVTSAAWQLHTGGMARVKRLGQEQQGAV